MYFEEISAKLIFGKYAELDLDDYCKLEIALTASKNDWNEEEYGKAKAKQLKNKKYCLKQMKTKIK